MRARTLWISVPVVGLVLAGAAFAPPSQAAVATYLDYQVGCSTSVLALGATPTPSAPSGRILVVGGADGLPPGVGIDFVSPAVRGGAVPVGTTSSDGHLNVGYIPVSLKTPLTGPTTLDFAFRDVTGGPVLATGQAKFRARDGGSCGYLVELTAGATDPSGLGFFRLAQQSDGNVVERNGQGRALWSSGTAGHHGAHAIMQDDGNLVIRDAAGRAVWNTGTAGHPFATLTVQTDSNLVLRDRAGRAVWSSGIHR